MNMPHTIADQPNTHHIAHASVFQPGTFDELACSPLPGHSQQPATVNIKRDLSVGIHGLPVEILRAIFLLRIEPWYDLAALQIAQVCSYWRAIALSFPQLWRTISFCRIPPRCAKLYYERAGNLPLKLLHCDPMHRKVDRELFNARDCTIETLDLTVGYILSPYIDDRPLPDKSAMLKFLTTKPASSWTAMTDLSLSTPSLPGRMSLVLNKPLFQGQTPSLRHLSLRHVRMPWNSGFYRNLESLNIEINGDGVSPLDKNVSAILQDCPRLHSLTLDLFSKTGQPWRTHVHKPSAKRINLPYLRYLSLKMPASWMYRLLEPIDVDTELCDVRINLKLPTDSDMRQPIEDVVELLQSDIIIRAVFPRITRMIVDGRLSVLGYKVEQHGEKSATLACLEVQLVYYHSEPYHINLLDRIFEILRTYVQLPLQEIVLSPGIFCRPGPIPPVPPTSLLPCRHFAIDNTPTISRFLSYPALVGEPETLDRRFTQELQLLSLRGAELTLGNISTLVEVCKRIRSLQLLRFDTVTFLLSEENSMDDISDRLGELGIKVESRHCQALTESAPVHVRAIDCHLEISGNHA